MGSFQVHGVPPPAAYTSTPHLPGSSLNSPRAISNALLYFPIPESSRPLAESVNRRVCKYMSQYDNSHDYEHVQRVVANAVRIWVSDPSFAQHLDPLVVFLACMMHDVGDHKYLKVWESGAQIKEKMLRSCGASKELARKVQIIASHVSYTFERKNPAAVAKVLAEYPELAIVQDADRLDALGPVGQARCFAYHGVSPRFRKMSMNAAVQHMWEKLWLLPGMMKTKWGREEGERLWEWNLEFQREWQRQIDVGDVLKT